MTHEEKAVVDAAIAFVESELWFRDENSREGWALIDAVNRLPSATVMPLTG